MNKAVIALGSNIKPRQNIETALKNMAHTFSVIKKSQFIFTEPVGYKDQADFLNGSVLVKTELTQAAISRKLKQIEHQMGRKRGGRPNGPRKIDLDLVMLNGQVLDDDVFERNFLKQSVQELRPESL